jgi:hypothetical protein
MTIAPEPIAITPKATLRSVNISKSWSSSPGFATLLLGVLAGIGNVVLGIVLLLHN